MKGRYKAWYAEWLLRTKIDLKFEKANWQRRIKEIESGIIGVGYPPVAEYRRRIAKIEQEIADVVEELRAREMVG